MSQRWLATNTPAASEGPEGTPYNAPYGDTPLIKRAVLISILRLMETWGFLELSTVKGKSRDKCHIVI